MQIPLIDKVVDMFLAEEKQKPNSLFWSIMMVVYFIVSLFGIALFIWRTDTVALLMGVFCFNVGVGTCRFIQKASKIHFPEAK